MMQRTGHRGVYVVKERVSCRALALANWQLRCLYGAFYPSACANKRIPWLARLLERESAMANDVCGGQLIDRVLGAACKELAERWGDVHAYIHGTSCMIR